MEGLNIQIHRIRPEEGKPTNHSKRQGCLRVLIVNVNMVSVKCCKVSCLQILVGSAVHNCFGQMMALRNQEGVGFQGWDQKRETATVHDTGMQWE